MIEGALLTGWFCMMRASELLPQSGGEDPTNRALRPADVAFFKKGLTNLGGAKQDRTIAPVGTSVQLRLWPRCNCCSLTDGEAPRTRRPCLVMKTGQGLIGKE
jgi:hypothetical protein